MALASSILGCEVPLCFVGWVPLWSPNVFLKCFGAFASAVPWRLGHFGSWAWESLRFWLFSFEFGGWIVFESWLLAVRVMTLQIQGGKQVKRRVSLVKPFMDDQYLSRRGGCGACVFDIGHLSHI